MNFHDYSFHHVLIGVDRKTGHVVTLRDLGFAKVAVGDGGDEEE